jgi:hypothetical protein
MKLKPNYLQDRIAGIPGVCDILACPSVEEGGKYELLGREGDFNRIRTFLMRQLTPWFDEYVSEDAKQIIARYTGLAQVAPVASDGYSSGEDLYMVSSINTALSYTSNLSDITNVTHA